MSPRVACRPRGKAPAPQSVDPGPHPCHRLLGSGAEPPGWSSPCAFPTPRVLVRAEPPAPAPQRCPQPQATKRRNERQRQSSGFIGGRAGVREDAGAGGAGRCAGVSRNGARPGPAEPPHPASKRRFSGGLRGALRFPLSTLEGSKAPRSASRWPGDAGTGLEGTGGDGDGGNGHGTGREKGPDGYGDGDGMEGAWDRIEEDGMGTVLGGDGDGDGNKQ